MDMDLFSYNEERQTESSSRAPLSVSAYLDRVNRTLKGERAKIVGEITEVQMYEGRSYLYFSIKDSADQSKIKCFMWKKDYTISGVQLRDGIEVVLTAFPQVYKPNGGLSLQVGLIELVGEGALQKAYEELKKKLELEGLFSESRKRVLPKYPERIGVITSRSGAVIHDFLSNIGKFGFEILFVDSKVEGQDAIKDLLSAVNTLKSMDVDVLVLMRGGGSLESFAAFNNETLVRALADFPVPVITGIGHDKDAPLVSLVSDRNVSTPTAVAHLVDSTWREALSTVTLSHTKIISRFERIVSEHKNSIERAQRSIENRFGTIFDEFRRAESALSRVLGRIEGEFGRTSEFISRRVQDMHRGFTSLVSRTELSLTQSEKIITFSSPTRQLSRGYSIVRNAGKVVRKHTDVRAGDTLDILVSDGTIETKVI